MDERTTEGGRGASGHEDLLAGLGRALREGIGRIRAGSARLARLGRLNLDLLAARGRLRRAWNELGELAARRWLDEGAASLDREDPAIAAFLERIRAAREDVAAAEEALRATAGPGRSRDGSPPPSGSPAGAGGGAAP